MTHELGTITAKLKQYRKPYLADPSAGLGTVLESDDRRRDNSQSRRCLVGDLLGDFWRFPDDGRSRRLVERCQD